MASGLTAPLAILAGVQVTVALPLLLPFPSIRSPSISLYDSLSKGPGGYGGGTLVGTLLVLLGASAWEAASLQRYRTDNNHEAMMTAVQLSRSHLAASLCFMNVCLSVAFWRLSQEIKSHDKLQKSHSALQRQAAGISAEYSRVTSAPAAPAPAKGNTSAAQASSAAEDLTAKLATAKEEGKAAADAKVKAQKELEHVKMQLKSLEASYDALMSENMSLNKGASDQGTFAFPARKKAE